MKKKELRSKAEKFVKNMLRDAEGGHDWNHIERVLANAKMILKKEKGNKHIVLLGILLHDIADPKFQGGDETKGIKISSAFLEETGVDKATKKQVLEIVKGVSFKGGHNKTKDKSKELQIAQDADRLDAIGAIGIARAFSYGGFSGRKIYDPKQKPREYKNVKEYRSSDSSTINHFYEKLLTLKDAMNTKTARKMAKRRHEFMIKYLEEFYEEVNGKPGPQTLPV
jgi:uncharacterized protein